MSGAGGLTLLRADAAACSRRAHDASTVAYELAARARFDRALADAHDTLATLAFDVAEGIIGRAVTADAAVLDALVTQALARARGARRVLACVHPDDVAAARSVAAAALADGAAPDSSLSRGSVAIETSRGRVTADWAESLALARARWIASIPEPSP
jgi:flagellar biosynthesis/type III secretory pathway protein FliH